MKLTKYGHACLLIEESGVRLLVDPGSFSSGFESLTELNAVMYTHQHGDHLNLESLKALLVTNPEAQVIADEGSAKMIEGAGIAVKEVHAAAEFQIGGVKVAVYGTDHAIIYPSISGIPNVGYMVADKFFDPGDSFTLPGRPVDVLALPLGAPWLKVSEVVDYVLAVKPRVAVPVHDAVLAMPEMHTKIVGMFADPAGIEVMTIANGTSAEV